MGVIFDIQRFCVDDGPGIRTTVFLKGCPLDCIWCHNPESKSSRPQHYVDGSKLVGFQSSVDEIISIVLRDKAYYEESGGGLTLSGGEPLMQPNFAFELLETAKRVNIHTCVETCGFIDQSVMEKVLPVADLFLFDIKATRTTHKQFTGVENTLILSNLYYLHDRDAKIIMRCPIIPTINDTEEHFKYIASLSKSLPNLLAIEIMPYHNMGVAKAEKLGIKDSFCLENPTQEQIKDWKKKLVKLTGKVTYKG